MEDPEKNNLEMESSTADTPEAEAPESEASEAEAPETGVSKAEASETDDLKQTGENMGPNIFQRILLWAAIVISAIFLLLGLAGIIGVWAANTPVTNTILAILQPIENSLLRLETTAGEAGVALNQVSTSLDNAQQRVQELGAGLAETSLVAEAISQATGADLEQSVDNARANIRSIYDTVVAVEETIAAINAIPLVQLEVPGSTEMATIRTGMEEMATDVAELRQEAQQRREERAENLVNALNRPLNRLQGRVEEFDSRVANAEQRLGLTIQRLDTIQSSVPLWVDIVSIVYTLLLAWLMFSQWAVINFSWRALHP